MNHSLGIARASSETFLDLINHALEFDITEAGSTWANVLSGASAQLATIYYNLAATFVQEQNYEQSMQLLEALLHFLEELDEPLVFSICFLFLEVYLRLSQIVGWYSTDTSDTVNDRVLRVLNVIDRLNASESQQRPGLKALESLPDDIGIPSKQCPTFIRSLNAFKVYLYQSRCMIEMNQLKQSKKAIKNALEIYQKEFRPYIDSSPNSLTSAVSYLSRAYFGSPMSSIDRQNQLALYVKVCPSTYVTDSSIIIFIFIVPIIPRQV